MRAEDLKNYGKGLLNAVPDPEALKRQKQTGEIIREELQRELGHGGYHEIMSRMKVDVERMKHHDWSVLRKRGLNNHGFVEGVIRRMALVKCLADMVGMDRASEIQCKLLEKTIYESMAPMWPTVEDYYACGDFFKAFSQYTRVAMMENERAGLHVVEMAEDSPAALAFNVKYCVWHEVARAFGDPYSATLRPATAMRLPSPKCWGWRDLNTASNARGLWLRVRVSATSGTKLFREAANFALKTP